MKKVKTFFASFFVGLFGIIVIVGLVLLILFMNGEFWYWIINDKMHYNVDLLTSSAMGVVGTFAICAVGSIVIKLCTGVGEGLIQSWIELRNDYQSGHFQFFVKKNKW
jgi:hypothetical protein